MPLYLDIETDWSRRITVIGLCHRQRFRQLVGPEVNAPALQRLLPRSATIYTFNGHCFDLPVIRQQLGIDLRQRYRSVDLRYACKARGLTGGQKLIERRLGIARELPGLDGRDALSLWQRYQDDDDRDALRLLLAYNREDVLNLAKIHASLESMP
ncbi:MAG TPA: ribonuclease H-like domain-containing protein [Candidatus Edwardsbacteria bacterium]|nr:ribonuclease H-like domain-containing protein [Candidatus Edwardsbacteria bacterium]